MASPLPRRLIFPPTVYGWCTHHISVSWGGGGAEISNHNLSVMHENVHDKQEKLSPELELRQLSHKRTEFLVRFCRQRETIFCHTTEQEAELMLTINNLPLKSCSICPRSKLESFKQTQLYLLTIHFYQLLLPIANRDVPVIHPVPGKCRISHYSVLHGPGKIMGPSNKKRKIFFLPFTFYYRK